MKLSNLTGYRRSATTILITCIVGLSLTLSASGQKFRYFGTNLSDWAVFTFPSAGGAINWRVLKNENPSQPPGTIFDIPFGLTASELVPNQGNWGGSGADDLAIYRDNTGDPANYYIVNQLPAGPVTYFPWGNALTDFVGAEGDYDGDDIMDYTIVRAPTTSSPFVWWIMRSSDNTMRVFTYGTNATDIALPGADYTGDGIDDPTVARVNTLNGIITWMVGSTSGAQVTQAVWGDFDTDFIIAGGDYDGDGKADYMVWRGFGSVNANWYLLRNTGQASQVQFGIAGGAAVRDTALRSGDYDGDGKTDIAIYRPSTLTFYVLRSSGGVQTQPWGVAGNSNLPIASFGIF